MEDSGPRAEEPTRRNAEEPLAAEDSGPRAETPKSPRAAEDKVKSGLLLDVVVRQCPALLELLTRK